MGLLGSGVKAKKRELGAQIPTNFSAVRGHHDVGQAGHNNTMKMALIGVCGARRVGKSALIDAFCRKHVTSTELTPMTPTRAGPHRYYHPDYNENGVVFQELSADEAATQDFLGYSFLFVVIEYNVDKLACEAALRAVERDIPVAFVATKVDLQTKRLQDLCAVESVDLTIKIRDMINTRAVKEWYSIPDNQRVLYLVSVPAMWSANAYDRKFDENALYNRFKFILEQLSCQPTKVVVDINTGSIVSQASRKAAPPTADLSEVPHRRADSGGRTSAGSTPWPAVMSAFAPAPTIEKISSSENLAGRSNEAVHAEVMYAANWKTPYSDYRNGSGPMRRLAPHQIRGLPRTENNVDPAHASKLASVPQYRICFIEEPASGPTIMEAVLGYNASSSPTILSHTPYSHPEFDRALFFFVPMTDHKDVVQFFRHNDLARMRLMIVTYTTTLKDTHLRIIHEARHIGVDVICCERIDDLPNRLSPKRAFQKIQRLGAAGTKKLARAGLTSVSCFKVNPRNLRITESRPRTDEEDFKQYIDLVCRGKTPVPATARRTPGLWKELKYGEKRVTELYDGSNIFPQNSLAPDYDSSDLKCMSDQYSARSVIPKPAMKGAAVAAAPPQKSVGFSCRKDIMVAIIGAKGVGKTVIMNHTLGTRSMPANAQAERCSDAVWSIRHPEYYNVVLHDFPGYDAQSDEVGTPAWIYGNKLHTMDWILLVFNEALLESELCVCQYALAAQVPVICIATKADILVDRFVFEDSLTEANAVDKTRSSIFQIYWLQMDDLNMDSPPLFILSGRALGLESRALFDELQYDAMFRNQIARNL